MALTEQRILKQITILPTAQAINVQWADQVLRDGEVISENFHRAAYTKEQFGEFLAKVPEGADAARVAAAETATLQNAVMKNDLAERDATIADLASQLAARDATIADLTAQVAARDAVKEQTEA